MAKVKFNVNTEYAYLQNFKILTCTPPLPLLYVYSLGVSLTFSAPYFLFFRGCRCCIAVFTAHQIDRPIPVERLVKCKFQDNLEFLQWTKRYWDQYYPGGDYDALSRRKGQGSVGGNPPPAARGNSAVKRGTTPTVGGVRTRTPIGGPSASALQQENHSLKESVQGLERERDFYFSKLRDIELLVQSSVDENPDSAEDGLVKHIQGILYSTEVGISNDSKSIVSKTDTKKDGFEIPDQVEEEDLETF